MVSARVNNERICFQCYFDTHSFVGTSSTCTDLNTVQRHTFRHSLQKISAYDTKNTHNPMLEVSTASLWTEFLAGYRLNIKDITIANIIQTPSLTPFLSAEVEKVQKYWDSDSEKPPSDKTSDPGANGVIFLLLFQVASHIGSLLNPEIPFSHRSPSSFISTFTLRA